jgi:SM-20-related protein
MLKLSRLDSAPVYEQPFRWSLVERLFSAADGAQLAASFPTDHYMTIPVDDVERPYSYEARSIIKMGRSAVSYPERLAPAWCRLAEVVASPAYRAAMSRLTGLDLASAPMEANLYQYGPQGWLKPHCDIGSKVVTHVLYFNDRWRPSDGGCLRILDGPDISATVSEITPTVGRSAVIMRSDNSWHAVTPVRPSCSGLRRSMNIIFYVEGFSETMWPFDGEAECLHDYAPPQAVGLLSRMRSRLFA